MRPTWNVATIVEPLEKVSGSTSVRWLVVADPAQVACVNGSLLMTSGPTAHAGSTGPRTPPATAAAATADMAIFRRAALGTRRTIAPPLNQPTALSLLNEAAYTHRCRPGGALTEFAAVCCLRNTSASLNRSPRPARQARPHLNPTNHHHSDN